MSTAEKAAVLPIREEDKPQAMEQQIDPWDVQAAHDAEGNVLAFDYVAISQYVSLCFRAVSPARC